MKIYIFYNRFFDIKNGSYYIGGIETYIKNLVSIFKKKADVIVVQFSKQPFNIIVDGVNIVGISCREGSENKKIKKVTEYIKSMFDDKRDVVIYANDSLCLYNFTERSIVIQHGIGFDSYSNNKLRKNRVLDYVYTACRNFKNIKQIESVGKVICVDYNFLNWYRTVLKYRDKKMKVIPNFCDVPFEFENKACVNDGQIKIVFARRYEIVRGIWLFANVAKKLLEKYNNITVTFSGSGSKEEELRNFFANEPRVDFQRFLSDESIEFHKNYNIAVVPSLFSEGTSLSLLEAMAAGCSVVATNVGGITNIVLDGYNGMLINPDEEELLNALKKIIEDAELRKRMSYNAYNSVKGAFIKEKWQASWIKEIEEYFIEE